MDQTSRNLGVTIDVKRDIVMYHTVLCIDHDGVRRAVAITTNPLQHAHKAQIVMHKTRSHGCAVQVARFVRRTFDVTEPVATHKAVRPVEAMIGYACTQTAQYPPESYAEDVFAVVCHIAETPISVLLKEVAGGHNASRTRYVVYEVRCTLGFALRGVTNKYDALERRYMETPPDTLLTFVEMVQISRCPTHEAAVALLSGYKYAGDHLWQRKPHPDYLSKVLRATPDDILFTKTGESAVRRHYDFPAVVIGPHVYTEAQIRHALVHGAWHDGRHRT